MQSTTPIRGGSESRQTRPPTAHRKDRNASGVYNLNRHIIPVSHPARLKYTRKVSQIHILPNIHHGQIYSAYDSIPAVRPPHQRRVRADTPRNHSSTATTAARPSHADRLQVTTVIPPHEQAPAQPLKNTDGEDVRDTKYRNRHAAQTRERL